MKFVANHKVSCGIVRFDVVSFHQMTTDVVFKSSVRNFTVTLYYSAILPLTKFY